MIVFKLKCNNLSGMSGTAIILYTKCFDFLKMLSSDLLKN